MQYVLINFCAAGQNIEYDFGLHYPKFTHLTTLVMMVVILVLMVAMMVVTVMMPIPIIVRERAKCIPIKRPRILKFCKTLDIKVVQSRFDCDDETVTRITNFF